MLTAKFVKSAAERAVQAGAATALSLLGVSTVIQEVDIEVIAGSVVLSMVVSVLTSIAGTRRNDPETGSWVEV